MSDRGSPETSSGRSSHARWLLPLAVVFGVLAATGGVVFPLLTGAWVTALLLVVGLAVAVVVIALVASALTRERTRSEEPPGV